MGAGFLIAFPAGFATSHIRIRTQKPDKGHAVTEITPSSTDHPLYPAVVEACRQIYDPEIPINIFDLGLIYTITINAENRVDVQMTLTSPACPVAGEMPGWVAEAVASVEGVTTGSIDLVWEPAWGMDRMTEEAQLEFGLI